MWKHNTQRNNVYLKMFTKLILREKQKEEETNEKQIPSEITAQPTDNILFKQIGICICLHKHIHL